MLDGLTTLDPGQQFPDEIFYRIFEIDGNVERTQYIEALRNKARLLKRANEFNTVLKAFFTDYAQKMKETGNSTNFTGQPTELQCGPWRANDLGVTMQKFDGHGMPVCVSACTHPIMPVKIYKNIDTGKERVMLAYFKYGQWQSVTVNRKACADNKAIVDVLSDNLEEGFQYFPADQITDHPERFLVSEMIREKVLQLTREEIPHSVAVVIDEMKRDEDTDKIHIRATIMVERDSQKGIVIGKQGSMLKKIGTLARKDIEVMLGDKVFLETWVKVKKNWRDKKLDLADFGYNEKEY